MKKILTLILSICLTSVISSSLMYYHLKDSPLETKESSPYPVVQTNSQTNSSNVDIESWVEKVMLVNTYVDYGPRGSATGAGSAVTISDNGYLLSNYHVIENAQIIQITDSENNTYRAEVVSVDKSNDLALLKINADNLPYAKFASWNQVKLADKVYAIGNPLGEFTGTVTEGIISSMERNIQIDGQNLTLLQTSASINSGNSGGALFNEKGELIGIVTAKSSGVSVEGLGFAIPINQVESFLSKSFS